MKRFTWLYPGMNVKRWFVLILAGVLLMGLGMSEKLQEVKQTLTRGSSGQPLLDAALLVGGLIIIIFGIIKLTRSLLTQISPTDEKELVDIVYRQRLLKKGPKVVAIGGGTGLPVLLHAIKEFTSNITAVVAVTDDGGSSGELRKRMRIPPPGDIRNCLIALADAEPLMGKLFQYRFEAEANISGHNFGNLFIAALTEVVGDFEEAVRQSSKILSIRGRVVPVTTANARLKAHFTDGTSIEGEALIPKQGKTIDRLELLPANCVATPEVQQYIAEADMIILGPGSLYTSVIPNLLVPGIPETIRRSEALKIYICNVMTQPGETTGYSAAEHLRAIHQHAGGHLVDYLLVNNASIPAELLEKYSQKGAAPVACQTEGLGAMGVTVISEPLISQTDYVRHDGAKLGSALFDFWLKSRVGGIEGVY